MVVLLCVHVIAYVGKYLGDYVYSVEAPTHLTICFTKNLCHIHIMCIV